MQNIFQQHLCRWRVLKTHIAQSQPSLELLNAAHLSSSAPKAKHGICLIGKGHVKLWA